MRSLLLFAFVVALMPVILVMPYVGVLTWAWLSFMNPHRDVFGAGFDFQFVFWTAAVTLGSWLISKEPKKLFREPIELAMLAFVLWTVLTTATAINHDLSTDYFVQTLKSFVLAFAVIGLMTSKSRMQAFIWIIAISLGYYAVRGAFSIFYTGGLARVSGPDGTLIGDNNTIALAFVITLPLLNYLRLSSRNLAISVLVTFVIAATIGAIILTYSRGGLVGLVVVAAGTWLSSRGKLMLIALGCALLLVAASFLPQQWYDRMETIRGYSADISLQGRVEAWHVALNIANDRPLVGGGFNATLDPGTFTKYDRTGVSRAGLATHSIYFQVLGDHGYPGLFFYLFMILMAILNLNHIIHLTKSNEEQRWLADLARMMRLSFAGFLVCGALLSMAYYDVPLCLIALTGGMLRLARQGLSGATAVSAPRWRRTEIPT